MKRIIKTRIHDIEWSGEDWEGLPEEISIDLPMFKETYEIKYIHKSIRRFLGDFYQRKINNSSITIVHNENLIV